MFTGLVTERGRVASSPSTSTQGGVRLEITHSEALRDRLGIGASLAVNGVCLTITEETVVDGAAVSAVEMSPETLERTSLGDLKAGAEVNLEPALRLGDALGGHWVQGHVDNTVEVLECRELGEHVEMAFSIPSALAGFLVEKGSVTLDGVSLTVSKQLPDRFEVALIPHTLEVTTLGDRCPGDRLNLEIDVLAKYVHQALDARGALG
ncbi:MAG: riboflavin synthase [Deltaproteobacteria bacterium]|nr:riboflavin synthase [Deltaproteobacteria bacterium]